MPTILLSKLLNDTPLEIPSDYNKEITGLALDSRKVQKGNLFLACVGAQYDARNFIPEAIVNGASAVLAELSPDNENSFVLRSYVLQSGIPIFYVSHLQHQISQIAANFFNHPANSLRIVGITGTNGKTSCSHFMASALQYLGTSCGVIGTLGMGLYGNIHSSHMTTPDALTLQKTFTDFLQQGAKAVAMEVSSHSIDQERVKNIPFEVGIFTNLTRDHLDYHGTMEAYGRVKKRLFESPLLQNAVINIDDPFGVEIIHNLPAGKNIYAYSVQRPSAKMTVPTIFADNVLLDITGLSADVFTPWGNGRLQTALVGQFNLSNVLAVLTALCLMKFPFADVLKALAQLKSVPGRMETTGGKNHPLVVVDYAHTPDSLEKVLMALRQHCAGQLYCLFGCGGDRDKGKRPMMAKIAEKLADFVMVTDDNPRHEVSEQIAADIMLGFEDPSKIIVQLDRSKAIQDIIQCAKVGDCILIAGRGGETHQQIGDHKIPFNDAEKVAAILRQPAGNKF